MEEQEVAVTYLNEEERAVARNALTNVIEVNQLIQGRAEPPVIAALQRQGLIVRALRDKDDGVAFNAIGVVNPYVVLALRGPLLPAQQTELTEKKVHLLECTGTDVYRAYIPPEKQEEVSTLEFVRSIRAYGASETRYTRAKASAEHPADPQIWDITLQRPESGPALEDWLTTAGVPITQRTALKFRVQVPPAPDLLDQLRAHQEVAALAEHVPPRFSNDLVRQMIGPLSAAPAAHDLSALFDFTGAGETVAIADSGIDPAHPNLMDRIAARLPAGDPAASMDHDGHGTHVAGTVAAAGTFPGAPLQGVAPNARLVIQSIAPHGTFDLPADLGDLFRAAFQAGARIHNNSWGHEVASVYDDEAHETDQFAVDHPDFVIVCAAGNGASHDPDRPGDVGLRSIDSPATAKNVITVGANCGTRTDGPMGAVTFRALYPGRFPQEPTATLRVSGQPDEMAAFSGRGPCAAGRIKPDLVAPGTDVQSARSSLAGPALSSEPYTYRSGTSMAAPVVSGAAALVREFYRNDRKHQPSAALVKATLIAGAVPLPGVSANLHRGVPNYQQGFGRLSLRTTLPNKLEPALRLMFRDSHVENDPLPELGAVREVKFSVAGSGLPIRICLAYLDPPGERLQSNLNLVLVDPGNRKSFGNADRPDKSGELDDKNSVERIVIERPAAGGYTAYVIASRVRTPQHYALVITGEILTA